MKPRELNQIMVGMVEGVCAHLLPNGMKEREEWVVGSVAGEEGRSCKIKLSGGKVGVWSDFSTNDKGGDLIDLWMKVKNLSLPESMKDAAGFCGVDITSQEFYPPAKNYIKPDKKGITKLSNGMAAWFEGRGISKETLAAFKVSKKNDDFVFPYIAPDGTTEHIKYRNSKEKKFFSSAGTAPCLFGWQAIKEDSRTVVICEGEIDALSFHEKGVPALSVPVGGGNGNKQQLIEYEYDRLDRFDTIYLSMDNDSVGASATDEIVERLGRHRCKVIELPCKDANEVLMSGITFSFHEAMEDAKSLDPPELCSIATFHDEIMGEFNPKTGQEAGLRLPWRKTYEEVVLRPGEISVWAGINSHGKSIILSHVAVDGVAQGEKFCIASMEMQPWKLGRKMYQQVGVSDNPSPGHAENIKMFLQDGVWIFKIYGTAKAGKILDVFKYARMKYGINHFIVDSLAKCGFAEDDYKNQKQFVDELMEFAGEFNVHVHLVVHIRKKEDENKVPGKMDIKGTGAITDMVDNVFITWRNKPKEKAQKNGDKTHDGKYDTLFCCEKQRETGEEPAYALWFHGPSCQFLEYQDEEPKQYIFN